MRGASARQERAGQQDARLSRAAVDEVVGSVHRTFLRRLAIEAERRGVR